MISLFRLSILELTWAAAAIGWLAWALRLPARPSLWLLFVSSLALATVFSHLVARRRGSPWLAFVRATADVHAVVAALLFGLAEQFAHGHGITTDGVVYFSQLRSALFDHDLDLAREFAFLNQPVRPNQIVPIGPTIIWLPFYVTVAAIDWLGRSIGAWPAPSDPTTLGLGLPYVRAIAVSSFAVGATGLLLLHDHMRREFGRGIAWATSILIFGATTMFWYMVYEPSMTHAASFGFVAIFVVLSARWVPRELTTRRALMLGSLMGLAFLSRPQEVLFALFPAWLIVTGGGDVRERLTKLWHLTRWAFVGAVPWLVLQAIHTWILLSREEYSLVGQGGYLRPFAPRLLDTLFSSWHGFLSWTPIAYIAVIGAVIYLWRNWRWASCTLALLVAMAWVNGMTADWAAGWSFGGRRFTSLLVMLAPGLAAAIDLSLRRPVLLLAPAMFVALMWNNLLMVQYTVGLLPKDRPVSFADMVRQQGDLHTQPPYVYPFAFPANLWFAWREGLEISRYDLLGPEVYRTSLDLPLDRVADKFLLSGWDAPCGDDSGACWWMASPQAMLAVPLDLPSGQAVKVEVTARTRFDDPPVRARLLMDINGTLVGDFLADPDQPSTTTLTVPAIRDGRPWRRGYNKITFRFDGVSRRDAGDTRPPGVLAQQLGSHAWPVAIYRIRITPQAP